MSTASQFNYVDAKDLPTRVTADSYDPELASKSSLLARIDKAVVQVIDAPFDGGAAESRATFNLSDDLARGLHSLPVHSHGTARILDVTVHSDFLITGLRENKGPEITRPARDTLIRYLQETYMQSFEERRIFRWLNDPILTNDIGSIMSQWSQRLGGNANFYRVVNRSSLQQHPLDLDVHPRDSYLTCAQDADNRLIVIVVNDVWYQQSFRTNKSRRDNIPFQNPSCAMSLLSTHSLTTLSDGSLETFSKLLVLEFLLASIYMQRVDYYDPLIYPKLPDKEALKLSLTKNPHLQVPLGLFEPRLSAKSRDAFKEIEDAEGILRNVANLSDSILFVIKELNPTNVTGSQDYVDNYKRQMQTVKKICEERRKNAERALEALNRQLDYLAKQHAIREAKSIKILTILASFYLPFSLAASILGMQSPLKKIAHDVKPGEDAQPYNIIGTNLLFDFFGVFVVLATSTIFIVLFIRFGLWIKSNGLRLLSSNSRGTFSIFYYGRYWKYDGVGGTVFDIVRVFMKWWIGAGLCVTLLVIFLVGMLHTAQEAWNTARAMFFTYMGVGAASVALYFVLYKFLYVTRVGTRGSS